MKHIHAELRTVREKVVSRKLALVLLDLDGTLAPIAPRPETACVPDGTKKTILHLSNSPAYRVAIVTGRSVDDAKNLLEIDNAIYAGNHGLELQQGSWRWLHPLAASLQPDLTKLTIELVRSEIGRTPGLFVEDKGLTVSVHYREATQVTSSDIKAQIRAILKPYRKSFLLTSGKKVFEVRPRVPCDKGTALTFIRDILDPRRHGMVIYIGDDQTDEDAFSALSPGDVGIRVGNKSSSKASYFVRNTDEVATFLRELVSWNTAHLLYG